MPTSPASARPTASSPTPAPTASRSTTWRRKKSASSSPASGPTRSGLDPTRHSAKVTRDIADKLAKLAKSFESAGHHAEVVAAFLMRCLFTFFAEDVGLIDKERADEQPFTDLLKTLRGHSTSSSRWPRTSGAGWTPAASPPPCGGSSSTSTAGCSRNAHALPVTPAQLELLIQAGESDWSDVEPAIFGTLLERALEPRERHKLGAHYTPRAYVERLVLPTVIEPLREKWDAARAAAFTLNMQGKNAEARAAVHDFLAELCRTTVLDPACGSGNFPGPKLSPSKPRPSAALAGRTKPATAGELCKQFKSAKAERVAELLATLARWARPGPLVGNALWGEGDAIHSR